GFAGSLPAESLPGSTIERSGHRCEFVRAVPAEVGALGEVLAQQPVGVLVGPALPGALGIAEVDVQTGCDLEVGVPGHLHAAVPGERTTELGGKTRDRRDDGIAHGLRAVAGECRPVLDPRLDPRSPRPGEDAGAS